MESQKMWRNHHEGYGWVSIGLHWLMALLLLTIFGLGVWMVGLSYTDAWYHRAPGIHKSLGVLFFTLVLVRLAWRYSNPRPAFEDALAVWEKRLALLIQWCFYLLMLVIPVTGYLISTAKGRPVAVFDWFEIPATLQLEGRVDMLGEVHETLAWLLIALVCLHLGAALKHHLIDKDKTLIKMLKPTKRMG